MTDCGMCETPIEHGYLCARDTQALADRLHRMPQLYAALQPFLTPGSTGSPEGPRSGRSEAPLPVVEHVLDLRGPGGLVGILEDWHAALQRDRGFAPPQRRGSIETRIRHASLTLARNTPSIAADWPAAGDLARETHDVERTIASITGAIDQPRGQRIGPCPAQHDDGSLCGAILRLQPGETVITCSWCSTAYPPSMWRGLKELIDHDQAAA